MGGLIRPASSPGVCTVVAPGFLLPGLLAIATVASTATKLRFPSVPFGLGEVLLLAWLGASFVMRFMNWGMTWERGFALRWGSLLLLFTATALLLGSFLAGLVGTTASYDTAHEAAAWAFILVLAGWFLLESGEQSSVLQFLRTFAAVGVATATVLLLAAVLTRVLFGWQGLWYMGVRLSGWSENPNQFATLLAPLPFLASYFARLSRTRAGRRFWWLGITGTLVAGVVAQSDALLVAWILGFGILVGVGWVARVAGSRRTVTSMILNAVFLPLALAALLVPVFDLLVSLLEATAESRANEGGQAGTRLTLWTHGTEAVLRSPFFGWGPGSHSGLLGAFGGVESHNTFIDLAAQAGVPVSMLLVCLIGVAVFVSARAGMLRLGVAILALATLAAFHNVLRQPVFWFCLFAVMNAGIRPVSVLGASIHPGKLRSSDY
jgi:O-antigen ligase